MDDAIWKQARCTQWHFRERDANEMKMGEGGGIHTGRPRPHLGPLGGKGAWSKNRYNRGGCMNLVLSVQKCRQVGDIKLGKF